MVNYHCITLTTYEAPRGQSQEAIDQFNMTASCMDPDDGSIKFPCSPESKEHQGLSDSTVLSCPPPPYRAFVDAAARLFSTPALTAAMSFDDIPLALTGSLGGWANWHCLPVLLRLLEVHSVKLPEDLAFLPSS